MTAGIGSIVYRNKGAKAMRNEVSYMASQEDAAMGQVMDEAEKLANAPVHQMNVRTAIAKDVLGYILQTDLSKDAYGCFSSDIAVEQAVILADKLIIQLAGSGFPL